MLCTVVALLPEGQARRQAGTRRQWAIWEVPAMNFHRMAAVGTVTSAAPIVHQLSRKISAESETSQRLNPFNTTARFNQSCTAPLGSPWKMENVLCLFLCSPGGYFTPLVRLGVRGASTCMCFLHCQNKHCRLIVFKLHFDKAVGAYRLERSPCNIWVCSSAGGTDTLSVLHAAHYAKLCLHLFRQLCKPVQRQTK